jgi:hypothetical protein
MTTPHLIQTQKVYYCIHNSAPLGIIPNQNPVHVATPNCKKHFSLIPLITPTPMASLPVFRISDYDITYSVCIQRPVRAMHPTNLVHFMALIVFSEKYKLWRSLHNFLNNYCLFCSLSGPSTTIHFVLRYIQCKFLPSRGTHEQQQFGIRRAHTRERWRHAKNVHWHHGVDFFLKMDEQIQDLLIYGGDCVLRMPQCTTRRHNHTD